MIPADRGVLSPLQRAIVTTAAYSDLFDYPLTRDELRRYLTVHYPGDRTFDLELEALVPARLHRQGDLFMLPGRRPLVALRRRRQRDAEERWRHAARFAGWLRHVPFVRMVAVCGSQAAGNPRPEADIDFFLVIEDGRLWLGQVCAMLLRRVASWLSVPVCPNYLLTLGSLKVAPHDLYHAREVAQAVPLWGGEAYRRFRAANRWVDELLPNLAHADDRTARLAEPPRSQVAAAGERLLGGFLGDLLERAVRATLLRYYAVRLRHLGWRKEQLRRAYRADRQEVMRGGYGPVVEQAFRQRASEHLPDAVVDDELLRLFPRNGPPQAPDGLFARQFVERYGHGE